ncbi:hypothetical protein GCM10027610_056580 [Dactylosporangium cerinum]
MHVDEVGGRSEVVDGDQPVGGRQALAAAQRVVVVVDRDRALGLLLQPDPEALQRALFGVRGAVGPGVVLEHEDPDLAERQRVGIALLGEVDLRVEGAVSGGVVGQGDVLAPHLVVLRTDRDQVPSGGQIDGLASLVAFAHDRAVALGRHVLRERVLRLARRRVDEARVVDVDDVVEVRQCGV